jgi:hypothetical protein
MQREIERVPLCIDLDGTLLRTDLLHESVFPAAEAESAAAAVGCRCGCCAGAPT